MSSESYAEAARRAEVMMSYRVWPDPKADLNAYRETGSFATAFRWIRWEPAASVQVGFRWRVDDREGEGCVAYRAEWHPTASDALVEATIRNMITVAIADALAAGRFILIQPEDINEARAAQAACRQPRF